MSEWARYAAKAVTAALVAFTVAGGTILAALADDRVTATEWVTIALAIAGAIVGPVAVYGVQNRPQAAVPADSDPNDQAARDSLARLRQGYTRPDHLGQLPPLPDRDTRPWTGPE